MRRFRQQISDAEYIEILKSAKRGVLSLIGDDGAVALNLKRQPHKVSGGRQKALPPFL